VNDPRVERWFDALLATPGLTGIRDPAEARQTLVEGALAALSLLGDGPVVDVGAGGGSPGVPLAAARPDLEFDLLEATAKKCRFLEAATRELPNVSVVCARAEEHAGGEGRDRYGTALARALAPPPVAAEWTLPLVRPGGRAVLFVGASAQVDGVRRVAERLAAELAETPAGFVVLRKTGPTPEGFPRRPGVARKRPLA
jgi:16S rRNA (guanine527-N7)-methyltransferase